MAPDAVEPALDVATPDDATLDDGALDDGPTGDAATIELPVVPDPTRNRIKLRLMLAGVDPAKVDEVEDIEAPGLLRQRLLWGDDQPIALEEVAQQAGLDVEVCRRARMLMGLPDPGDEPVCRTMEVETFRGLAAGIELYGEDAILQFTRVLGSAMATIAEGSLSVFGRHLARRGDEAPEGDEYVLAAFDALESFRIVPEVLGVVAKLQFDLAADRLNGEPGRTRWAAIGFVDLTGSTRTTSRLGDDAMAPALTRFEEWAAQLAVANDGRVVKYIGDEVMYLAPDLPAAARVATGLIQRVADD